jgi:hypothetical protein
LIAEHLRVLERAGRARRVAADICILKGREVVFGGVRRKAKKKGGKLWFESRGPREKDFF